MHPATDQPSTWADRAFMTDGAVQEEGGTVYRIRSFIGRGGMGEVYEVERTDNHQRYALKCLRLEHTSNARIVERTRREALTLRALRHPNVVPVHATGVREDGLIWMVMDLLEGHTLAQIKHRLGRLPLPWTLRIGRSVADGLAAVHTLAVHRDVKAENIHFGNDAVVRILDLGAGKFHTFGLLTTGTSTVGTVPYMSPEQLAPKGEVDNRSDLFSLGILLAELISGAHPFAPQGLHRENVFTMVNKIVSTEPVSLKGLAPWAPAYVVEVVDRAVQKDKAARFADAAEMSAALDMAIARLEHEVGPGEPLQTLVAELNGPPTGAPDTTKEALAPTHEASASLLATEDADTAVDVDTLVMQRKAPC